jgi:hypothetical protein
MVLGNGAGNRIDCNTIDYEYRLTPEFEYEEVEILDSYARKFLPRAG